MKKISLIDLDNKLKNLPSIETIFFDSVDQPWEEDAGTIYFQMNFDSIKVDHSINGVSLWSGSNHIGFYFVEDIQYKEVDLFGVVLHITCRDKLGLYPRRTYIVEIKEDFFV